MKKASLLIALLTLTGVFSQKQHHKKPQFSPEQKIQLAVKKLTVALELNDKQIAQITPIVTDRVKKMEAAHQTKKERRKEMSTDEKFKIAMTHLDAEADLQTKMKKILKKDQYADWKKMHKKHLHKLKAKHLKKRKSHAKKKKRERHLEEM